MHKFCLGARQAPVKCLTSGVLLAMRRHKWRRRYKLAPSVKTPKPLPRSALRDGVTCGGSQKVPPLLPAPFSSPSSTPCPSFCRNVTLLKFAHTRVKRRLLQHLVLGCHSATGGGTQGFTGATARRFLTPPSLCFLSPNF